ncbi:TPA: cation:proton antiporter [Photobacterium damselae]|uniref:Na(+)/H(+) antiporter n=4 Tax=Photobacterium damselae TaxID=38293 RepID=D0Z2A6_PHODD|nr:sodium:proton antiporter [Photobacterium damselae]EEZ39537.1 Na(+)/H(+) antiporter [Photobacterium damselae subsp. damselae CIP 102761]ELI6450085.1 sodium:proton antiporter [Photobacterium damselae]ELV7517700.1 sodium:proton antiporter [Photobacterium damselae]KAB1175298.1 sodium:proton antiporter [Photobacterium damselae subsp. damselae]KAB1505949.1 sodium:proton antiporter [Photobacterium damselae subsp. damselae]
MSVYDTICIVAAIAVFISMFNHRFGKFQTTIAITGWSMIIAFSIMLLGKMGVIDFNDEHYLVQLMNNIQFDDFLLKGVLGFLLFGGALNIELSHLKDQKIEISILALAATLFSTFFIGTLLWAILAVIGVNIGYIYCCLFGALISPTDPIAVLAIVKKLKAPQRISTQIEGESLFNDGVGLVIFVTLFEVAFGNHAPTVSGTVALFIHEAVGGIAYGLIIGGIFHYLIKHTHDSMMRLILTMLVPTCGYVIGEQLGVSAPLAMVTAGIIIGNWTRSLISAEESHQLSHLWELADEILNAILFLLIGFVMVTFSFHAVDLVAVIIAIPLVLLSRYISVKLSYVGFGFFRRYNPMSVKILTWGGLRGGLALAMAMAIPTGIPSGFEGVDIKELIVLMTYAVVVFSIIIQGSTITPMIEKAKKYEETGY